jgi:hypothetical protein
MVSSRGADALFELLHFCLTYHTVFNSRQFQETLVLRFPLSSFVVCHHSSSYQIPDTRVEILRTRSVASVDGEVMRHILVELVVIRKYREAVVQYLKLCMLRDEVIDDWTCLLASSATLESVRIHQMETFPNHGHDH